MIEGHLFPRVRAGVHVDAVPPCRVMLGDTDLRFKGVPDALVRNIIARFDGRLSLDELRADYGRAAPVVALIATEMRKRRMLLLAEASRDTWETASELIATPSRAYIEDRAADPATAAARWRSDPILVSGQGPSFVMAVSALADAGAGELMIGANDADERAEIEHLLAGTHCRHRFVDAAKRSAATLHVRVIDGDVYEDAVARDAGGPRILAGIVRGAGVVARARAGEVPVRPLLPVGSAEAVSGYARTVIGNLAAFQALDAIIAGEVPLAGVMVVRADGGLYAADPGPGAAPSLDDRIRSPFQSEREQWVAIARPFLAAPAPLLGWADEAALPSFPIAHRGLRILPEGALVTAWAASPSEVTTRAIRAALEALADRLTGSAGHAAGRSQEEWAERAYIAWAERQAPVAADPPASRRLRYDDDDDIAFRTLVRLTSLYLGEQPAIAIGIDPGSGLPRADVAAGGFRRFALGRSALHAAIEALGRILSALQLDQPSTLPASSSLAILPCDLDLRQEVALRPEQCGLVPEMLDELGGLPVDGFVLGRFVA
ncbi:hypothetical protein RZN05_03610 [Sphingomonas sp. HF-S4]|uniref:YcaO domain-containing protein n=1 Tax=Sphingomonas agrestis TaxID=3080540 RepID=A0ABU3Y457_9SPHN|nr:hypothetical protein [Sphingomonas sp. HF-S4]MDV3456056.1 hypothetical protein [Sphingomonas sp. HF-S4]